MCPRDPGSSSRTDGNQYRCETTSTADRNLPALPSSLDRIGVSVPDPRQTPFGKRSLTTAASSSNSRFFTDCYHHAAVFTPPRCRKSGRRSKLGGASPNNPTAGYAASFPVLPKLTINFSPLRALPRSPYQALRRCLSTARSRCREGSGCLAAEESRDIQVILLRGVVHRPLTPVRVQALVSHSLVSRPPGVVGDRIRAA